MPSLFIFSLVGLVGFYLYETQSGKWIKKKGPESLWIRGPWLLFIEVYSIELQVPNPSAVFLVAK
jgi:hypothetical protein